MTPPSTTAYEVGGTKTDLPGVARMTFARIGAATVARRTYATSPVKLFTLRREHAPACWVYTSTLGGGLVGGDEVRMTIDVGAGARALVATQASTKVYRSLRPARQIISGRVEDDGLLAILPDPLVCFADADFSQRQSYALSNGASLVLVDWITAGRHAAGERWDFARYDSRIQYARQGRLVLFDGVLLERTARETVADRMGRFRVYLTAVISGPLVFSGATEILSAIARGPIERDAELLESASPLEDGGVILRIAGVQTEQVGLALRRRLAFLHPLLGDDPWARKW